MDVQVITVTLQLALATTGILVLGGLPLAWWLARTRSAAGAVVETLVALPLVLPPTVLGFYVLLLVAPDGPAGRAWHAVMGSTLPFSFAGILVGSVLFNLPFAVRPFTGALELVDPRLVQAAYTLGASRTRTFLEVVIPVAWPGIRAGAVMTFAHAIGEFGVVLMVGGNVQGRTRTLSIAVFDAVQAMDYRTAHVTSAALLAASFLLLMLVGRRRRGDAGV